MLQHDEVLKMAKQAQVHEELCGEHFIYEFAKLVDAKATAKEREACESIEYDLAKSPAMFATMAEYKAYKDGVQDYRTKIIARGEA